MIGNDKKGSFAGRKGTIVEYIRQYSQYQVLFDDGITETVYSLWIDLLGEKRGIDGAYNPTHREAC